MSIMQAYDQPLSVEICEGEVVLIAKGGPFGISLTADAAAKTAEKMAEAARIVLKAQPSQDETVRD